MTEVNLTILCMVCFDKTTICQKEDGEVVICDNCKLEKREEQTTQLLAGVCPNHGMKRILDKDGKIIGNFKEVLLPENLEQTSSPDCEMIEDTQVNDATLLKCEKCDYTAISLHMRLHKQKHHQAGSCQICQSNQALHQYFNITSCHPCK